MSLTWRPGTRFLASRRFCELLEDGKLTDDKGQVVSNDVKDKAALERLLSLYQQRVVEVGLALLVTAPLAAALNVIKAHACPCAPLPPQALKLWEFFVIDVDAALATYKENVPALGAMALHASASEIVVRDEALGRFNAALDTMAAACALGRRTPDAPVSEEECVWEGCRPRDAAVSYLLSPAALRFTTLFLSCSFLNFFSFLHATD